MEYIREPYFPPVSGLVTFNTSSHLYGVFDCSIACHSERPTLGRHDLISSMRMYAFVYRITPERQTSKRQRKASMPASGRENGGAGSSATPPRSVSVIHGVILQHTKCCRMCLASLYRSMSASDSVARALRQTLPIAGCRRSTYSGPVRYLSTQLRRSTKQILASTQFNRRFRHSKKSRWAQCPRTLPP